MLLAVSRDPIRVSDGSEDRLDTLRTEGVDGEEDEGEVEEGEERVGG